MKKQITTKIILGLIIFIFVVSIFQFVIPTQTDAATISGLYSNPNQNNSKNPYKFKVSDVVNSNLLTNVVGCTGVVNKVSTWMMKFVQNPVKQAEMEAKRIAMVIAQLRATCTSTKAGAEAGVGATPVVNDLVSAVKTAFEKVKMKTPNGGKADLCTEAVKAETPDLLRQAVLEAERDMEIKTKEQCLDGIAITLAKNQLTAMTRSMMNWVNSGYGGNPFFVQNMKNLTTKLENNVIETGIDILLAPGNENPYARDFARTAISSRGIVSGSSDFLSNLQSDLSSFITDPRSYYTNEQLSDAERTELAVQRARDASNAFSNDFATGGWNGWLAFTQRDQNNPLGFSMLAGEYLAETQRQQATDINNELTQNDGFLSQKTCIRWQIYDPTSRKPSMEPEEDCHTNSNSLCRSVFIYSDVDPQDGVSQCSEWKTITPGSLIKEKTTNYLNSPERQLELAKTINDSLNALFSVLISKLQGGGLPGLSDATVNNSNWTDTTNDYGSFTSADGNSTYDNNGAYDGFNLTRDLGNTYLHVTPISLGSWNANSNQPTLSPNSGPTYTNVQGIPITSNLYYTVSTAGSTYLITGGNNYWAVGDRAFWDGKSWQNWKSGQANPIKKRGVIQIQEDYIFAAKQILKVLPGIMPKLGELDYCLPGPNPSYKSNSTEAQSAYQDWVSSMYVGLADSTNERFGVRIDGPNTRTYDNLQDIYKDNPGVWAQVLRSMQFLLYAFSNICNSGEGDCTGNYFYERNGNLSSNSVRHLDEKTRLMEANLDYVNNSLFQNFYEVFDKMMDRLYFKNITREYIEEEDTAALRINTSYVDMAQEGYDLTKNMLSYNEDTEQAIKDYTDAISQANANLGKLNPIRTEVSNIINAAQERRRIRMLAILNAEAIRNGTPVLTEAQYNAKYADCLDEENMEFFDTNIIVREAVDEGDRCNNGLDDDYDGLIDLKDIDDCLGGGGGGGSGGGGSGGAPSTVGGCQGTVSGSTNGIIIPGPYEGQSCLQFNSQEDCLRGWLTHGCNWNGPLAVVPPINNTGTCPTSAGWSGTIWPNCSYTFTSGGGGNSGPCPTDPGWSGTTWPNCSFTFGSSGYSVTD